MFDVLHAGHIEHFLQARNLGDFLVVSVTSDSFVNKGPGRPIHSLDRRMEVIASLQTVDAVFASDSPSAIDAIRAVRPDIFVKGPDYKELGDDLSKNIVEEKNTVETLGGYVYFTDGPTMSSSAVSNSLGLSHGPETEAWLSSVRDEFSEKDVSQLLANVQSLNVVVVGEPIIDEYTFCEALGKSSKDPVLAFLRKYSEIQIGGSYAVAKHLVGLGARVRLVTRVGEDGDGKRVIKSADSDGILIRPQISSRCKTIRKTRYVDLHSDAKVFETYDMLDELPSTKDDRDFASLLESELLDADLVVVADYGHGLLTTRAVEVLTTAAGYVAVNTQMNAGNRGFNSISRYPRADIISLNGGEVSLELRDRRMSLVRLLPDLGSRSGADWVVVTQGSKGLALWSRVSDNVYQVPAFTEKVKDRVGAGDAVFAMVSALLAVSAPHALVGLLGNLAGVAMVADLGNRQSISADGILKHASVLLKKPNRGKWTV